jgi:hypothetical protein
METAIENTTQRLPSLLWESLQEVCYRQDHKFICDVSRILGVPAAELKRKILGTRGVLTTVLVESGPWWTGMQCKIVERNASLWKRCDSYCESGDTCAHHAGMRNGWNIRRIDDPYFADMKSRFPVRIEGVVYWADEAGTLLDSNGLLVDSMTFDLKLKLVRTTHVSDKLSLSDE